MKIKVLIVDDHTVLCDSLRALLETTTDIRVAEIAINGRDAIKKVQKHHPNIVLMDIAMPGLNGIDATRSIRVASSLTRIIMLSMHGTAEHIYQAIKAGADGFLLKESTGWEVVDAVRTVYEGRRYFSRGIAASAINDGNGKLRAASPIESLSKREREILHLVVDGKSSAEIAEALFLSPKTVNTYRSRLMQKLAIDDVAGLVKFAIQHGLTVWR